MSKIKSFNINESFVVTSALIILSDKQGKNESLSECMLRAVQQSEFNVSLAKEFIGVEEEANKDALEGKDDEAQSLDVNAVIVSYKGVDYNYAEALTFMLESNWVSNEDISKCTVATIKQTFIDKTAEDLVRSKVAKQIAPAAPATPATPAAPVVPVTIKAPSRGAPNRGPVKPNATEIAAAIESARIEKNIAESDAYEYELYSPYPETITLTPNAMRKVLHVDALIPTETLAALTDENITTVYEHYSQATFKAGDTVGFTLGHLTNFEGFLKELTGVDPQSLLNPLTIEQNIETIRLALSGDNGIKLVSRYS